MAEPPTAPTAGQDLALARLVTDGTLDQQQADAVRAALWTVPVRRGAGGILTEVAGYIGGTLMLGGAVLLIGLNWSRFNRGQEILLLAGVAVALILAGVLVAGGPQGLLDLRRADTSVRRRVVGLLLPLSAVPAALMVEVASPSRTLPHFAIPGLVVALVMYGLLPSVPGLLTAATMSGLTAWAVVDVVRPRFGSDNAAFHLQILLALVVVGLAWGIAAVTGFAPPRRLSLAVAAFYLILGAQITVGFDDIRGVGYLLTALTGAGCLVLYWWERATVLIAAAVIALSLVALEVVNDVTHNAVAGPVGLLVGGAVLVGASALGFWLRSVRERGAPPPR